MKQPPMMMMLIPEHVMKALKGADDESGEGEPCPRCGKMHGDEDEELDEDEMADAEEEMSRVDMKKVMEKDRRRRAGEAVLEDDEDDEDYNG